jgi:hypothetical protein
VGIRLNGRNIKWELGAIAAYAQALDAGRVDDLVALFTPDGLSEIAGVGTFEGRDALRAAYAGFAPKRPQLHLVSNTVITSWTDDEATSHGVSSAGSQLF